MLVEYLYDLDNSRSDDLEVWCVHARTFAERLRERQEAAGNRLKN
jgi:hypothetical protein